MIVKRFSAKTAEEALALAKWELGDEAIILSSGKSRDRWWKIWETGFQVLVATDYPKTVSEKISPAPAVLDETASTATYRERLPEEPPKDARIDDIMTLLQGMDRRLGRLQGFDSPLSEEVYQDLVRQQVSEDWARMLAQEVDPGRDENTAGAIRRIIQSHLKPPAPISVANPTTVVFVGPTGSGKTTTIAKLATYFHLEQKKDLLLISTDTFRVGAVEQLKTYAEIIGVPFEVALRPQDVENIIGRYPDHVILIDTAGHSAHNPLHMGELRTIVQKAGAKEILLTIPATMDGRQMVETATLFGAGLPVKLCVTKRDETVSGGGILSAILTLDWPLAYVTDGQGVPDDIQVAFPQTIVSMVQGDSDND